MKQILFLINKNKLFLSIFFILISIFYTSSLNLKKQDEVLNGKIVKITDGDTINILTSENDKLRIRFYGIDAPESSQKFGKEAKNFLAKMCPLGSVASLNVKSKDKYGRIVAIVSCGNYKDVNSEMVKNGYAWAYRSFSKDYVSLENSAKQNRLGLWIDNNPINPADYRKERKKQ